MNYLWACTVLMDSFDGTVEEVVALMKEVDWVHFACTADPRVSGGLCLANKRRLKLRDITSPGRACLCHPLPFNMWRETSPR